MVCDIVEPPFYRVTHLRGALFLASNTSGYQDWQFHSVIIGDAFKDTRHRPL